MGIAIDGIASGIDTASIIDQLLSLENRQVLIFQRKIAEEELRRAAFGDLNGRLQSLRTAARGFNADDLFGNLSATSTDDSIVTVSATKSAPVGTQSVEVLQVATSHRIAAQGFVDNTATGVAAGAGTFEFRVGDGPNQSIEVDSGTSLRDLAEKINAKGAGVRADIVNDGSSTNPYRLVLTSENEGTEGLITVTNNDTTLDFTNPVIEAASTDTDNAGTYTGTVTSGGAFTGSENTRFVVEIIQDGAADGTAKYRFSSDGGLTFDDNGGAGYDVTSAGPIALADGVTIEFTDDGSQLTAGDTFRIDAFNPVLDTPQDAILKVNGINITKSSNTIDDIFDGLTLNLNSASAGKTVNLTVGLSAGDITPALSAFVGAYNSAIGFLNQQFAFDPASGAAAPPLNGDAAVRQVQKELKNFISGRLPGLGSDTVSALSELGISSNEKTGLLSLDTSKLDALLNDDPTAVERVLTSFGERLNGNFDFVRRSANSIPGVYEVEVTQARTRAQVGGTAPAEVLAANESVRVGLNTNGGGGAFVEIQVDLLAGTTPAQQVAQFNQAFADNDLDVTAFLDTDGALSFRANTYGGDYAVRISSDQASGPGTTNVGLAVRSDTGTDLEGTIGGRPTRVLDGTHLKGDNGYDTEGIEVIIPDDTSGSLGRVRIADGVGESLPSIIDNLSTGRGILASRTSGIDARITQLEENITRQERRTAQVEERLRRQFTNLEVTLGRLQSLGDYVSQQLAALAPTRKK